MSSISTGIAASVLARLKNEADRSGEAFNPLLARYVGFRFLYRISQSSLNEQFLIKGATMFLVWTGSQHRPTRDIDLLLLSESEVKDLAEAFKEICQIPCLEDGVMFDPESVSAQPIREDNAYGGTRVTLVGRLGSAKIPLQIDVGLGDVVTPQPNQVVLPSFLDSVPPTVMQGYPVETAIAEKFEAMVSLGMTNSRMKDLFDIALLADTMTLASSELGSAVKATFQRRRTEIPRELPTALTESFLVDPQVLARWNAFTKKNRISDPHSDLSYVQARISNLLMPIVNNGSSGIVWMDGMWHKPDETSAKTP